VRRIFAGGGAVGLAMLALPVQVQAQQAQQVAPQGPVARVEVTGSNIRRAESETTASVLTVSRADIERSGKKSVGELLQTLPVDNAGSVPASFGNGFAAGASGISLRGLGASATLVLVNGRRMAPYGLADDGQKQFSDLNVIPTDAVDRIEILKDGGSSVYGSDAIAGVVNVILRKDFTGAQVRASDSVSTQYWDGEQANAAFTMGTGDLDNDKYNFFVAIEYKRNSEATYNARNNRDWIGKLDLRPWGYSAQQNLGGTGAITTNNAAGNAINGNVRNPDTLDYFNRSNYTPDTGFTRIFPNAACSNLTNHPQGDPGGGCLTDAPSQYGQVLPYQENWNLYTRGTFQVTPTLQAYTEFLYYSSSTDATSTPSGISTSVGSPAGPVSNAGVSLGADHPDNPYFGTAARLRYLASDVGARTSRFESNFLRWIGAISGTNYEWDWSGGLLFSHSNVWNGRKGFLQRDVTFALLNPTPANVAAALANSPAYAALPAGTVWRIAENAGLNSPAMYAALSPEINGSASTKIAQVDFKATRAFKVGLPEGPLNVAIGTEWRHEMTTLNPVTGTETGNIIGLGFSAYDGNRNVYALYGELLAPIWKNVELTGAIRWDHFTDVDNAYTPMAGVKWTPSKEFALRGTYYKGFRAPSPAENGRGGLAAFSTATDPVRCNLGVEAACDPAPIALITSPNPNLSPEKSKSYNLGFVWSPLPKSNITVDFWQVKRENEINQEQVDAAIAAGHISRDPTTADASVPGDPGAITAVLASYVNSAQSKVRGIDFEGHQGFTLPEGYGSINLDLKWTHLYKWLRTELDGTTRDFAGTHGNCDVTNCIGTPRNRANFRLTWDRGELRVTLNANARGPIKNVLFQGDPDGCAVTFADGSPAPNGCELASFIVYDLVARWKPTPKWEIFGSIQNLWDKVAPLDPLTYGAQAYNPLDYQGALGRMYTVGARYTF
jgi:iron complex outermembrane receptor protein